MDNTISLKRLEIVVSKNKFSKIASLFSRSDVRGYTIIKHAGGLGSRGPVENGDVTLNDGNVVVILACQEQKAQKVLAEIQPIMEELGGICLISDCLWLEKPKATY